MYLQQLNRIASYCKILILRQLFFLLLISINSTEYQMSRGRNSAYFIHSSKFNVYLKQIKVILSTKKNIVFFTSDEFDLYFDTVANRGYFDNFGLNFFPKRSGQHRSCLFMLRMHARQIKQLTVTIWRHLWAHVTLIRTRRQSDGSFKRLSSVANFFLFILSLKWHDKPFYRCKLRLHPIYYPLNELRQARLTKISSFFSVNTKKI